MIAADDWRRVGVRIRSFTGALAILFALAVSWAHAQSPVSAPQVARPTTLQFDVASVRQSKTEGKAKSNIALGPGDVWGPNGGVLDAENFPLLAYIEFAYKMTDYQVASLQEKLPGWVKSDQFDIKARTTDANVTKAGMRLMMQSLLADRFGLEVHYESRTVPAYALVRAKPGELGPKLRAHPADADCPSFSPLAKTADGKPTASLPDATADGFPTFCGGILGVPASAEDRYSFGARAVPMSVIASSLSSWGNLGRPVVDATGLKGLWDFVLDFTPDPRPKYATVDSGGPTFEAALQKQLGLKLDSTKSAVEFLVLDRVHYPTAN